MGSSLKLRGVCVSESNKTKLPTKMRLLFALPVAIQAQLPGYSSTCDDTTGLLHINIPYENPTTAELLSFTAGTCSGSGASSTNHAYAHDATTNTATLSLNIAGCGLNSVLYDTPYLTRNGEYYMATANVTLGATDNGNNLIFYNAVLGAECGHRTDYQVTFNYAQLETVEQTGCQTGPNGECVLPAFELYNFTLTEYTDDTYSALADATTRETQANEMIYLRLSALDLPADKKFAIKKCRFVDDSVEYPMFSPYDSVCDNRYIDLDWSYQNNANDANIAHRLFLLAAGDQDSYQLVCDVKVCYRNDHSSECNAWSACLDSTAQQAYVCDSLTCPADAYSCGVSASSTAECSYQCNCDNGTGDIALSCAAQQCSSCNGGYTLTGGACVLNQCTCSNGVATSGTSCATHNTADCQSCNSGYVLSGSSCVAYSPVWTAPGTYNDEVRLSHTRYGYVMVWYNGEWNSVCDDYWDIHADHAVCRGLFGVDSLYGDGADSPQYSQNNPFVRPASLQPETSSSRIIYDNVDCNPGATDIMNTSQCSKNSRFYHNCDRSEDTWVVCEGAVVDPSQVRRVSIDDVAEEARLAAVKNE